MCYYINNNQNPYTSNITKPMANSYFKFKQFTIYQDKCAMKVCTDTCLFGAIAANQKLKKTDCLDIGTGTGILPLMLAQKNDSLVIDAVEIDPAAAEQAEENIAKSPWADIITVINEDILSFTPGKQYDYIISNPPFFENSLPSPDKTINKARHNHSLNLVHLLSKVNNHLSPSGIFAALIPYDRSEFFIEEASKNGLHLTQQILVKQTFKHKFFRSILFFKRTAAKAEYEEIIIKDIEHNYTAEFTALLKDYYLFL